MKKWFNIAGLLPAAVVGVVAAVGFKTTVPTLTEVIWPEEPVLTVEAEEKTDAMLNEDTDVEGIKKGVGTYEDGSYTGKGEGYGGITTVAVTVKAGQISNIEIVDHNDTPSFFNRAKDTIIDEILTAQTWEVDTVSGATFSSRGIEEAVYNALTGESFGSENTTEKGVGDYEDGTFTGVGIGYGGETTVSVTVEERQITAVDIVSHNDTPDFFERARGTVVEEILTAQTWEVDSVSGATFSSRGIKEAVCNALTGQVSQSTEPEKVHALPLQEAQEYKDTELKDGSYTGSAQGFGGTIKVKVKISNGKIKSIEVISHDGETTSYYNRAVAIIDNIIKKQSPNVDTISGATYSSNGIREAVKDALKKASGKSKSQDDDEEETEEETETEESQPEITIPKGAPADGTYTGTANCVQKGRFNYQISVSATYKDGKLSDITYTTTDDGSNENYISRAWTTIKNEILGDITGKVDAVSHATYTSNALKTAYKLAYKQAVEANGGKVNDDEEDSEQTSDDSDSGDNDDQNNNDQNNDDQDDDDQDDGDQDDGGDSGGGSLDGTPADGSYKVSVTVDSNDTIKASNAGWFTSYTLTGTVVFSEGKLTEITGLLIGEEPDDYEYVDDQDYLNKAGNTIISSLIDKQSSDVDVVSGATCSSKGIIKLYEAGLKEAIAKNKPSENAEGAGE